MKHHHFNCACFHCRHELEVDKNKITQFVGLMIMGFCLFMAFYTGFQEANAFVTISEKKDVCKEIGHYFWECETEKAICYKANGVYNSSLQCKFK